MALLKNEDTGTDISIYVSLSTKQEVIRTLQQTLDGNTHIQRIGKPAVTYEVTVYVNDEGKAQLMSAEDTAALLKVVVNSGTYYGRITEMKNFEKLPAGYYKTVFTLAKEPPE
ncbi:MAG: hypothetical protein A2Y17_11160 [Clostridiales bacterium GWF2_38_85]|nr:MAG: hypothetical protein A2Y17_11160 [Clostridiales bacterium GWF2_38_85]HBL84684.1 hypothetical protein [Clostridiales bacterium]